MKKQLAIFFITFFTIFTTQATTLSATNPAVLRGAKLFQTYCSACHSLKYLTPTKDIPAFPAKKVPALLGVIPPDLSLEIKIRGSHWVSGYLSSFYLDPKSPSGMNNKIYPGTVMPNMLIGLQAQMTPQEFNATVQDIVDFLSYTADPHQFERHKLGYWVLSFLIIFTCILYLLKRSYWKEA